MIRSLLLVASVGALALAACRVADTRGQGGVEGALAYRERIALGSNATYSVRALVREGDVRRQIAGITGSAQSQVPIPFRLNWPRESAGAGPVEIEAEIHDSGRRWVLPTLVTVPAEGDRETLGLMLVRAP